MNDKEQIPRKRDKYKTFVRNKYKLFEELGERELEEGRRKREARERE